MAIPGWLPRAGAAAGPSDAVIATNAGVVPGAPLLLPATGRGPR